MNMFFFKGSEAPEGKREIEDTIDRERSDDETIAFQHNPIVNVDVEEDGNLYFYTSDQHWYGVISKDEYELLTDAIARYEGVVTTERIRRILKDRNIDEIHVTWYLDNINDQDLLVPMYRDMCDERISKDFDLCMEYRDEI